MAFNNDLLNYEGGGFLLTVTENGEKFILLGERIKKPEDLAKDSTPEAEYFGGKREAADNDDPFETGYNELVEEVGQPILDRNWKTRVVPIHAKGNKGWIWCLQLELTPAEYNRFKIADKDLDNWDPEQVDTTKFRDYSHLTGRKQPVRKSIKQFVRVPWQQFVDYVSDFEKLPQSGNRMNDAKEYRKNKRVKVTRVSGDSGPQEFAVRAFNILIFAGRINQ